MVRSNLLLGAFIWEHARSSYFMEMVKNFALKIDQYNHINKYMKIVSTKGRGHLSTLNTGLSYFDSFKYLHKSHQAMTIKFHIRPEGVEGTKICSSSQGHIANVAAIPTYIRNL